MLRTGQIAALAIVIALLGCSQANESLPSGAEVGTVGSAGGTASSGSAGATLAQTAGGSSTGGTSSEQPAEPGAASGEGGAGGDSSEVATDDIDTVLQTYRSFSPLTPEPVSVSGYIFGLCRMPTLPETEFLASIHGDGRFLQDWVNPGAQAGIAARGVPAFPEGAVIVKEKYAGPPSSKPDLVALGIMIKRSAGFDSARGDWEYAYYEPALGVIRSAEQSEYCASCHATAAETDHVFVDGLGP